MSLLDLSAISFYIINSILLLYYDDVRSSGMITFYIITLITGFLKLYNDLQVIDTFRQLSNSLFEIFGQLKAFIVLFG